MKINEWKAYLHSEKFVDFCTEIYGNLAEQTPARYQHLLELFADSFGEEGEIALFSAPGRTEIGGNHTDHQHGRVMAASVNMDSIAAVRVNEDHHIRILSEGYPMCEIALDQLEAVESEKNSTAALIRGVAARFVQKGCAISGFDAAVTSSVLPGSGISSSAAFEVLVGHIINHLFFAQKASAVEIAQIGQYAENVYFGKPSGLMDQTASSVGNLLTIDFMDPENPVVRRLDVDFAACNLALCIIDSGADHANLTDEYAAIPIEIGKVCQYFGKKVLRDIPEEAFMKAIPEVRKAAGDRAVLRAMHFYADNDRVPEQAAALEEGNVDRFLELVKSSGQSSWMLLQNIIPAGYKAHQEMGVALAVCEKVLDGQGACRVHGGGFAGTIQAFVPRNMLEDFCQKIEAILGSGCCHVLDIRPAGGIRVPEE